MAHVVYKDYTIVYSSRPSEPADERGGYLPVAVVVWTDLATGVPVIHIPEFRATYASALEAGAVAFNVATRWAAQR